MKKYITISLHFIFIFLYLQCTLLTEPVITSPLDSTPFSNTSPSEEDDEERELGVECIDDCEIFSPPDYFLSYKDSHTRIYVRAKNIDWKTEMQGNWMSIKRLQNDTLLLSYTPNPFNKARRAVLRIFEENPHLSCYPTVYFTQEAAPDFTLSSSYVTVPKIGGDVVITVLSRVGPWSVSEAPDLKWLSVRKIDNNKLIITYSDNEYGGTRLGHVKISISTEFNTDHIPKIISLVQN